ncbi:hypothetical protein ESCO_001199 [Escovopsis weberi]|uniref:L-dopachrome isomerase n=1 Tax=Escovopsis weberi TaxID=150374 RepID=A0A0M8N378_ESCWE|nr:hypothetical protein ESCO_001199 [Escovopsis weberi]
MAVTKSKSLSKSNSQYFHSSLHERSGDVVGDLVRGEAMVMAELRTNVQIEDEFTFIVDFSQDLARRYNRPVDSIIVTVDHGKCMLFAGTMDPAYTLTISALPSEVQKVTNKRNTAVIQRYMEMALGVHSSRGFIRFIPVGEECVGWGGKTVLGRIGDAGGRVSPEPEERNDRRILKSISLRKAAPIEATPPATPSRTSNSHRFSSSTPPPSEMLPSRSLSSAAHNKPLRKKKSLMATFFRTAKYESDMATIPQDRDA